MYHYLAAFLGLLGCGLFTMHLLTLNVPEFKTPPSLRLRYITSNVTQWTAQRKERLRSMIETTSQRYSRSALRPIGT